MRIAWFGCKTRAIRIPGERSYSDAHGQHTPTLASLEEAITIPFCLVDDTYTLPNPNGRSHESLKRLSDSEILTLAHFQQLRASRASGPSCATRKGSSRTCFRAL
jgi:hypothetical protein